MIDDGDDIEAMADDDDDMRWNREPRAGEAG